MLGTTLTLPFSTPVELAKINQDNYSSEYLFRDSTHQYRARVRHTKTNAKADRPSYDRHNVEVVETVFQAGDVAEYERKFYFVYEHLPSDNDVELPDAVCDLAIATSDALLTDLLGWNS